MFVGVKLVGDTYVPAGEESTRVNTTDGSVRTFIHYATILVLHCACATIIVLSKIILSHGEDTIHWIGLWVSQSIHLSQLRGNISI